MKRSILLFTTVAGLCYFTLTSYNNGAATNNLDRTGGPLSGGQTCGAAGCHSGGATAVTGQIIIKNQLGQTVTQYIPDSLYDITITGSGGTYPKFGFQMATLTTANQKGGTVNTVSSPVKKSMIGSIEYVEHSTPINQSGGSYTATYKWQAPAQGTGRIDFYGIINAVNNNGSVTGDRPSSPITFALNEAPTSVPELSQKILITVFPNPTIDILNLKFVDAEVGTYTVSVFDIAGRKMYAEEFRVNDGNSNIRIASSGWVSGLYHAQIIKDGAQRMIQIVKQ